MHRIYLYMMGPAVLAALGVGCSSSSAPTDELQRVIGALGGLADVQAATSQSATATGKRYDQHEAFSAVPGIHDETTLQMTFTSTVVTDLDGEGLYGRWDGTTVEVFPGTHPIWTETSDGKFGYTTGTTSGFPPTDAAPMLSAQVIARRKQHVMATPIALVKYALANPSTVTIGPDESWAGASYHVITIANPWGWPRPVRLFVDPATHLPAKADTLEDDPIRGDTLVEVAFTDWQEAGSLQAPFTVTHRLNGSRIQDETRSEVVTNPSDVSFAVPARFQAGYDANGAAWGARASQYLTRFQGFAFALYFDQVVGLPPYLPGLRETVVAAGNGAQIVDYQFTFYNTLVVELPSSLVVIEAPLYEAASAAAIVDIKTRFPGKPVKAIVSTHVHFDHSGGIRRYLAEWPAADLYVPIESLAFYQDLVRAPHTVVPDLLATRTWTGSIRGVAAPVGSIGAPTVVSDGGARTVKLYNVKVDHSDGHVVAIVDDAEVLFTTDLYNPSAGGTGGPLPDGKDRPEHDTYARQLYTALAGAGYTPVSHPAIKMVGGHGAVGAWGELCVMGFGFGASGRPPAGAPIDPTKVCP